MDSISTVFLGRSYVSETRDWMRMLESKARFSMATSAVHNVFWAIACLLPEDTKVPSEGKLENVYHLALTG